MARILQVCNSSFYLSKFLVPLVKELAQRGHSVECLCDTKAKAEAPVFRELGVPVHHFPFPFRKSPWDFAKATHHLYSFMKEGGFDCVNSHNRNASIIARVAAYLAHVPANVYTAHGFYFHDDQSPLSRFLTEQLERGLAKCTTLTLSQSAEDAELMLRNGWVAPNEIQVIGNGIDTRKFRPSRELARGSSPARFRIAAMGRLVPGKGFEDLLRAFLPFRREFPAAELVFIGGNTGWDIGSSENSLQTMIRANGLEGRVTITGFVDHAERILETCDVFVHPSYREGMPRSLLEAMCMGLPVLASAIRGAREIVEPGENGFLFPAGNHEALAALLTTVARMPAEERARLGAAGRSLVLRQFAEDRYVERQVLALEAAMGISAVEALAA